MRPTALLLVVVMALGASPAHAAQTAPKQERGFLTGLGLGFLIAGLGVVGASVAGVVSASEAFRMYAAYSTVSAQESPTTNALGNRQVANSAFAFFGFIGGGLALVAGLVCLVVDTPVAKVAFMPTSQGGVVVFSTRF